MRRLVLTALALAISLVAATSAQAVVVDVPTKATPPLQAQLLLLPQGLHTVLSKRRSRSDAARSRGSRTEP
jgi:hypothetical protein